jgi:bifunctional NMN adenylyltransferase/nudix hydrolase
MKKLGVFIGRLQPPHKAHIPVLELALKQSDHLAIVLGSACRAKTIKNPWTTSEREDMVRGCFDNETQSKISIVSARDYFYNDNQWLTALQSSLSSLKIDGKETDVDDCDVTLYGHDKDRSTFYLHLFPRWKFVDTGSFGNIDATKVRELFFSGNVVELRKIVPRPVLEMLLDEIEFAATTKPGIAKYNSLVEEFEYIKKYKRAWCNSPYPPTFVTTDAIVIKSGHVLVGRRANHPGKGLLALPGGYLEDNERIIDGCLRELNEETHLNIPKDELKRMIVEQKVFDHPDRDLRGRTISHSFCIDLGSGELPKIKAADDMEKARWMPLREVMMEEDEFFADHFHIINYFVSRF